VHTHVASDGLQCMYRAQSTDLLCIQSAAEARPPQHVTAMLLWQRGQHSLWHMLRSAATSLEAAAVPVDGKDLGGTVSQAPHQLLCSITFPPTARLTLGVLDVVVSPFSGSLATSTVMSMLTEPNTRMVGSGGEGPRGPAAPSLGNSD
jgi:hypothetical protein